jgi:hypothetical protein
MRKVSILSGLLAVAVIGTHGQQPAAPTPQQPQGIEGARLVETLPLDGRLYHVQGVDLDATSVWVTSVDAAEHKGYLHQFDRTTLKLIRQADMTDGPRFHPGGFSIDGDTIWVPVAEYRPHSSTVLEQLDKRTLKLIRKIDIADSIGCVAVFKDVLVAGNWDSRQIYIFDKTGKQLRVVDNPEPNKYQDMKFSHGNLIASGVFTRTTGAIDWIAWPSMKLVRRLNAGTNDRGTLYTKEAMAIHDSDLYLLPEDGPSRLFHFVIAKP